MSIFFLHLQYLQESFAILTTSLTGGSLEGSLELFVISLDFSILGISIVSLILDCESSDPGVGSDCFFLNLAKVNF
jgi:hypothetical protein